MPDGQDAVFHRGIGAGQDGVDARQRQGLPNVNRPDARVRVRAVEDLADQHPGKPDIIRVDARARSFLSAVHHGDTSANGRGPCDRALVKTVSRARSEAALPQDFNRPLHRGQNLRVARAAAEVAGERVVDFRIRGFGIFREQALSGKDHARRAIAALRAALFGKTELQRVEVVILRDAFNGCDVVVGVGGREHNAGHLRLAIHEHGAGAATGIVAAALGARQPQVLSQNVEKEFICGKVEFVALAVDAKLNVHSGHGVPFHSLWGGDYNSF